MANSNPLSPAALQSVADQLGQFLTAPHPSAMSAMAPGKPPELAESLAVCFVSAAQVADPPKDLSVLARPSGMWHHQVRTGAGATHLARSSQQDLTHGNLQVEHWAESHIAAKLDDAIAWVDHEHPGDDATVRLLTIPAYYLHALLIIRGKKLSAVLVDQPPGYKKVKYQKEYKLKDFLKKLAKETPSGTLTS